MDDGGLDVLAIVGSGRFACPNGLIIAASLITAELDERTPDIVCSGGAPGVDTVADELANGAEIVFVPFLPKRFAWSDPAGGFKERNEEIVEYCTRLLRIACPYSNTYGSGWTADLAEKRGKPVRRRWIDRDGTVLDTLPAAASRPQPPDGLLF